MAWLCVFFQCRWTHIHGHVWQCPQCKTCMFARDPDMPQ